MKEFRTGLVVGKFSPLHKGHELLINTAIEQCENVIILSYSSPEFKHCEAAERRLWLESMYGSRATILVIPPGTFQVNNVWALPVPKNHEDDFHHRDFCACVLFYHMHTTVDAVFSSEGYGDGFAEYLTEFFSGRLEREHRVWHVCLDPSRTAIPVSGTAIRSNPALRKDYLSAYVAASFVPRVCLLGGESSGKTTLAKALAEKYGVKWVPEYGREFTETHGGVKNLRYEDMYKIAAEQVYQEERAAVTAAIRKNPFIVCDTSPLTTYFYSTQLFNGFTDRRLDVLAQRRYDFIFLCDPNIPFEQDGDRQDEAFRQMGHEWYKSTLDAERMPFTRVTGSVDERLEQIASLLRAHFVIE
jgi:NadR type nicotinamide-nucleotide adenylyltransferase